MRRLVITRPATFDDIADVAGVPAAGLKALARRHGITPPIRVGRVPFFGPREIKRIIALAEVEV